MAAEQEEIGRLLHLAGFGVVTAVTVWAAIGDIRRFAEPKKLVGYAGLGTRVHDSGMTSRTGKITKAGTTRSAHGVDRSGAMWLRTIIRTGKQNWQDWNRAWDATKRSWPSPESC